MGDNSPLKNIMNMFTTDSQEIHATLMNSSIDDVKTISNALIALTGIVINLESQNKKLREEINSLKKSC